MFASLNLFLAVRHPVFSVNSAPSALKSPLHPCTPPCHRQTTQLLPSFSTPSKHGARMNACNSFPLYALLHTSRHTPGMGSHRFSSRRKSDPAPRPASSATPLDATLTIQPANIHSKALTPELSLLDATFTRIEGAWPSLRLPPSSLLTTHHSLLTPASIRYTTPPRHT